MNLEILTAPPSLTPFYSVSIFPMAQVKETDIKLSSDFKSILSLAVLITVKWLGFFAVTFTFVCRTVCVSVLLGGDWKIGDALLSVMPLLLRGGGSEFLQLRSR